MVWDNHTRRLIQAGSILGRDAPMARSGRRSWPAGRGIRNARLILALPKAVLSHSNEWPRIGIRKIEKHEEDRLQDLSGVSPFPWLAIRRTRRSHSGTAACHPREYLRSRHEEAGERSGQL